ncbi:MAG TPA: hypothetical protein VFQ85_14230 [Mycobacteriales bacterium]|jgi:hypothetical protein|nr:hypothetical protein [Mycobacteriales bacterium]
MSALTLPRVAFYSDSALSNVSTANNQNVVDILDYDLVRLKNPLGLSPEAYREWLMELVEIEQNGTPRRTMYGYWNYYGDQLTTFGSATVSSVLLPGVTPATDDPLTSARVALTARIVDLDPADTFTSQMFTSGFVVTGTARDGSDVTLLQATQPTTPSTRWINFNRPRGSGNFYCVFPSANLAFAPRGTSAALDVLRDAVEAGAGLALRYCLYGMVAPYTTDEQVDEMRRRFLAGDYVLNAKVGRVVGTVNAWDGGDVVSAPSGTWLHPLGSPFIEAAEPGRTAHLLAPLSAAGPPLSHGALDAEWDRRTAAAALVADASPSGGSGGAPASADDSGPTFGPAAADVAPDGSVVSLDVMATFAEVGTGPFGPKADVGTVTLCAGGTPVAEVPYQEEPYERYGGVVDLDVPEDLRAQVLAGPLSLHWTKGPDSGLVAEQLAFPYVVVDRQCSYLDLPDATGSLEVRVFSPDGAPLAAPVTLAVEQWQDYSTHGDPGATPVVPPDFKFRKVEEGDPARMVPATLDVPAGGVATLPLTAAAPGCYKIRFLPPGARADDPNTAGWTLDYFCAVRVLPHDDYSHVRDEDVTWGFLWDEVLAYYALMYPVMSQYVPWGPPDAPLDPDRVRMLAAVLRELVDARNLDSPMYMPVTRELSAGKRELIRRWCDRQLAGDLA